MTAAQPNTLAKEGFVRSPRKIESKHIDVSALLQDGVVVTLSIGRWRGMQRLNKEDLGLGKLGTSFTEEYLRLGKKTLIPPEIQRKLNAIESGARAALRRYSFDTPFGAFVPAAAYAVLEEDMNEREAEWFAMRDELVKNLSGYEEEVVEAYTKFANALKKVVDIDAKRGYAKRYAESVLTLIPTKQEIKDSFTFAFQPFHVPVPRILNERVRQQVLGDEKLKRRIEMDRRIEAKFEREREQQVEGFIKSVVTQLRTMVFEIANNVIGSMDRNRQNLVGKSAGQLRHLIERYRLMNFMGDTEIDQALAQLEAQLTTRKKDDEKAIRTTLESLASMSRSVMIDMGMPAREVRRMELDARMDDVDAPDTGRRARRLEE